MPSTYENPVIPGNLADPAVIQHQGLYYLYATGEVDGDNGTRVYTSPDLVHWERGPVVFRPGSPHVWAPDVWRDPDSGRFYLYYTVNKTVGAAAADGPMGPFRITRQFAERAIDAHLFRDDDGKLYLYYVQLPGFRISVQPMSSPIDPKGDPRVILQPESAWETRAGRVTEGPWMIKHNNRYYLIYSGSGANTPDYAVGYATADNPLGPFTRASNNPIIQRGQGVYGPGHGCAIQDAAGQWWHVYHQKRRDRVEWDRFICIDPLWFDAEGKLHGRVSRGTTQPAPITTLPGAAAATIKLPATWEYSAPLIAPEPRERDPSRAQKDPTLVFYQGRWHVFMTVKLPGRSAIEYCSFEKWEEANQSQRTILPVSDSDYYCAPQVFYYRPHEKWYLIYQMGVPGRKKMWVAYSTTTNIGDPYSWTRAKPILDGGPNDPRQVGGLDYWIICDDERAYLFLTSLNGKMWRLWTRLDGFPQGFDHCELALEAEIFEASHTYKLKGSEKYLTIIEENGRRYYKAYLADRLDGEWVPLADTAKNPFAGWNNIRPAAGVVPWTDNVSHGELIRDGYDETLQVDPGDLRFVFQGMWDRNKRGNGYGQFQWRIGMLTPVSGKVGPEEPAR